MPLPTAPTKKGSLLISPKGHQPATTTAQARQTPQTTQKPEQRKPARQPTAAPAPIVADKKPVAPARAVNTSAPVPTHHKPAHRSSRKKTIANATRKLFVLDTNVMLHDPSCFFRFEEHDVYLPLITLEELDNHKKGTTETARHGRQVSRLLDELMNSSPNGMDDGIPLTNRENQQQLGKLYFQTQLIDDDLPKSLQQQSG